MKTAAELWADTIKKQPIDDLTIKRTCESIEELINKKTTGVRLAGLLSRAEAIILRQRKEISSLIAKRPRSPPRAPRTAAERGRRYDGQ